MAVMNAMEMTDRLLVEMNCRKGIVVVSAKRSRTGRLQRFKGEGSSLWWDRALLSEGNWKSADVESYLLAGW